MFTIFFASCSATKGTNNITSTASKASAEKTVDKSKDTVENSNNKVALAPVVPVVPTEPTITKTQENKTADTKTTETKPVEKTTAAATTGTTKAVTTSQKKVIVIDPGHANKSDLTKEVAAPGSSEMKIKDGGGAQGIVTRTPEYLINMKVSLKLKTLLEAKGYQVVMTKTDNAVSLGNVERANIWNAANAALAIRIHADSVNDSSVSGASMLVPAAINENTKAIYQESKRCGTIVLSALVNNVGMKNRGVVEHKDMTGFNWSKVPVILVEMGFLSNQNEDKLLSSDIYENKLAEGLCNGIAAAVVQ